MSRHDANAGHSAVRGPSSRNDRQVPDPEAPRVTQPDQDAADQMTREERSAREATHTDRDPQDDFHLAAEGRQDSAS